MEELETRSESGVDPGTFSFLQVGWWIFHIVAILGIFYLGYLYGSRVFG